MSVEFRSFPKIPRWARDIVITEKIDGTNTSVWVDHFTLKQIEDTDSQVSSEVARLTATADAGMAVMFDGAVDGSLTFVRAGSVNGFLSPKKDHYEFAAWVWEHANILSGLGDGGHFGEWYGRKIQRAYGMDGRRWALFNVGRWSGQLGDQAPPSCCDVVPVLYSGPMTLGHGEDAVDFWLRKLAFAGSEAEGAHGFKNPEGVVIYHTAGNNLYKKTIGNDGHKTTREANVENHL